MGKAHPLKLFPAGSKLVKWTADWCAPCVALKKAKTLEHVADELGLKLEIRDVESKAFSALAEKEDISALPTVQVINRSGKVLSSVEGAGTATAYVNHFRKALIPTPPKRRPAKR